jgi:hypothetical protein
MDSVLRESIMLPRSAILASMPFLGDLGESASGGEEDYSAQWIGVAAMKELCFLLLILEGDFLRLFLFSASS